MVNWGPERRWRPKAKGKIQHVPPQQSTNHGKNRKTEIQSKTYEAGIMQTQSLILSKQKLRGREIRKVALMFHPENGK